MEFFQKNNLLFIVLAIGVSFLFSFLINSILLKFAQTLGIRNHHGGEVRWSSASKPSVGGISFFVVFLITFIVLNFINNVSALHYNNLKIIGVFFVCTLAFLMGLADDAYNTRPLLKFTIQLTCGLVLYFTGTKIMVFELEILNFGLTVFWVVGFMNSINMLDNMDGISTIVAIMILCFVISLNLNLQLILSPLPILSLGLLGSLLGFLVLNWHPSKIFMGDTGSQFLGAFLSIIGIHYCWNYTELTYHLGYSNNPLQGFLIVFLVFILPLTDTITVIINRLSKGNSPFIGGKDHTTHHLFFKGITEKRIALLYALIGFSGTLIALNLLLTNSLNWFIISIGFCVITFLSLYLNTIISKK